MLYLVTEQREGEPPILHAVKHEPFQISSLDGVILKVFDAPASGWTHEKLVTVADSHADITSDGADGYVGGIWVGSTEV